MDNNIGAPFSPTFFSDGTITAVDGEMATAEIVFAGLFALTMAVVALIHFGDIEPALRIATAIIVLTLCAYMLSNYFQNGVFLTPLV